MIIEISHLNLFYNNSMIFRQLVPIINELLHLIQWFQTSHNYVLMQTNLVKHGNGFKQLCAHGSISSI